MERAPTGTERGSTTMGKGNGIRFTRYARGMYCASNGQDVLSDRWVSVNVFRADGGKTWECRFFGAHVPGVANEAAARDVGSFTLAEAKELVRRVFARDDLDADWKIRDAVRKESLALTDELLAAERAEVAALRASLAETEPA